MSYDAAAAADFRINAAATNTTRAQQELSGKESPLVIGFHNLNEGSRQFCRNLRERLSQFGAHVAGTLVDQKTGLKVDQVDQATSFFDENSFRDYAESLGMPFVLVGENNHYRSIIGLNYGDETHPGTYYTYDPLGFAEENGVEGHYLSSKQTWEEFEAERKKNQEEDDDFKVIPPNADDDDFHTISRGDEDPVLASKIEYVRKILGIDAKTTLVMNRQAIERLSSYNYYLAIQKDPKRAQELSSLDKASQPIGDAYNCVALCFMNQALRWQAVSDMTDEQRRQFDERLKQDLNVDLSLIPGMEAMTPAGKNATKIDVPKLLGKLFGR